MRSWGILGGSFDPIHNGHLFLAQEVYEKLNLEKIIFIPAYIAPHKIGQSFARAEDRFAMTKLAVEDNKHFVVSDMEIARKDISYTFDTIRALKDAYPTQDFYFIIGADSVSQLPTWHNIAGLFELTKFAVVYRPLYDEALLSAKKYFGKNGERIVAVSTKEYDVSSTQVRTLVQQGLDISHLVPKKVEEYIRANGLYRHNQI